MTKNHAFSYYNSLTCSNCSLSFDQWQVQTFCPHCQKPLVAGYDLDEIKKVITKEEIRSRPRSMWRWHELLPITTPGHIVSLGEGDTPMLHLPNLGSQIGFQNLFLKDEGCNPTGSFKARGLAGAISKAKELGIKKVIIPTAGNAGGAMAAYASRAGMQAHVVMPKDTPSANRIESQIVGAVVEMVDGVISDAAKIAARLSQEQGWFDLSTFKEPFRLEGKKVMGFEIAEVFNWNLPDVIIYPTGGGTGLVGIWKAFQELKKMGWIEESRLPRMIVVQATGCAPVVKAFETNAVSCEFWANAHTIASGLRVPRSFADQLILSTIRESGGTAIAVGDQEIMNAQKQLAAAEGVFSAPEGAATLAGLFEMQKQGLVKPDEKIVLLNTGTGLKYLNLFD